MGEMKGKWIGWIPSRLVLSALTLVFRDTVLADPVRGTWEEERRARREIEPSP